MSSKPAFRHVAAIALTVVSLTAATAHGNATEPSASTAIDTVTAEWFDDAVRVSGVARFARPTVVVGTDGNDATAVAPGSDLLSASIGQLDAKTLLFTLAVANAGPSHGTPEALVYQWYVRVTGLEGSETVSREFRVDARRTQQAAGAGSTSPTFWVSLCPPDDPCKNFTRLSGVMADGLVRVEVPSSYLRAGPGAVLSAGREPVSVKPTASAPERTANLPLPVDTIAVVEGFTVPVTSVRVGIAAVTVPDSDVQPTVPAVLASNGYFQADLPRPREPRSYKVVARACSDDDCAQKVSTFTVAGASDAG